MSNRQDDIRANKNGCADSQLQPAIHVISENAEWVSRSRINQMHENQHDRYERSVDTDMVGFQDKKSMAEARQ